MLKYGGPEDKESTLAIIRDFLNKGKENIPTASHVNTTTIPFTVATPTAQPQQALDFEQVEVMMSVMMVLHGFNVHVRVSTIDSKECNDSSFGFTAANVLEKLNGAVSLHAACDATDFLMLECHIFTTSEDNHYKRTTH